MERFTYLLNGYTERTLTATEKQELHLLMRNRHSAEALLAESFSKTTEPAWDALREQEMLQAVLNTDRQERPVAQVVTWKRHWFRYAAILLLIAGTATYLYTSSFRRDPGVTKNHGVPKPQDILPGGNKATLTLADGSTIILDSIANGALANEAGTQVTKQGGGMLVYQAPQDPKGMTKAGESAYNTIATPRGGQYQVVLPDGSKVWLNAASSITFLTAFTGKDRRVEIKGEAYLEIATDKSKPFYVKALETQVQVLGTSFNVNAYADEGQVSTTLLEGSVRVNAGRHTRLLLPGEQANADAQQLALVKNVDINKVMAWKNGFFNFENASLEKVMRQIARWYDIEVIYEKGIPDIYFDGEMTRDVSLTGLLKGLEEAGVHFRIEEGRRLIVYP